MRYDGLDAIVACYRLAGEVGVSVAGITFAELHEMSVGKRQLARLTALWQSAVLFNDKLDAESFVRIGFCGASGLTIPDELKEKVAREIARMNRSRK